MKDYKRMNIVKKSYTYVLHIELCMGNKQFYQFICY
jgi:hypothetical protein